MRRVAFTRRGSSGSIKLTQTGRDKFTVQYGFETWKGDYELAARKLGEALMHQLACDGEIENHEP